MVWTIIILFLISLGIFRLIWDKIEDAYGNSWDGFFIQMALVLAFVGIYLGIYTFAIKVMNF